MFKILTSNKKIYIKNANVSLLRSRRVVSLPKYSGNIIFFNEKQVICCKKLYLPARIPVFKLSAEYHLLSLMIVAIPPSNKSSKESCLQPGGRILSSLIVQHED